MLCEFVKRALLNIVIIAPLIFIGGAFYSVPVFAQEQASPQTDHKTESVRIDTRGAYRYITGFGIPHHAKDTPSALGIKSTAYAFRVPLKPQKASRPTLWKPGMVFGVALDGVPIQTALFEDGTGENWSRILQRFDQYGGYIDHMGRYIYGHIPSGLIDKDFVHIGYAADGFPIFVSRDYKFKTGYRLFEGRRPSPPQGPGGAYDGRYLQDYRYIKGAGALDQCNGLNVKGKYYIYVLTPEFPYIPQCWQGTPEPTFLSQARSGDARPVVRGGDDSATRRMNLRRAR